VLISTIVRVHICRIAHIVEKKRVQRINSARIVVRIYRSQGLVILSHDATLKVPRRLLVSGLLAQGEVYGERFPVQSFLLESECYGILIGGGPESSS
jgi:hypothetical protein